MPRMVKKDAHRPIEIKASANSQLICACGLSKNQPFCDKSHMQTLDEDEQTLYEYTDQGRKIIDHINYKQ